MRKTAFLLIVLLVGLSEPVAFGQTARTGRMMKAKLAHAQRILEALTTSNYSLLDRETKALSQIAASPDWAELKTPEFRGYTDAFLEATRRLQEATTERDLDAAAERYGPLTASCYGCHRHLKRWRIASQLSPGR